MLSPHHVTLSGNLYHPFENTVPPYKMVDQRNANVSDYQHC